LEGVEQPKISPKPPGNAVSDALLMSRFEYFEADVAKKNKKTMMTPRFAPRFTRF